MQQNTHKLLSLLPNQTQFAIALVNPTKITHIGYQKQNNQIQKIDNANHAFEIGSIAKVFTSNILCQLAIENKLKIDKPLSQYFPEIKAFKKFPITLKQLANHTSGLPRLPDNFYTIKNYDESDPYRYYDEAALLSYLNNIETLNSRPGEKVDYSNLGAGLLSYTLSKIGKQPFAEMVQQRIFQPLEMQNSNYEFDDLKTPLVKGLDPQGNESPNWHGGTLNGCIGAISTATDMAKFIKAMFAQNNPAIELQAKKTVATTANKFIGLGWGIREWDSGITTYNHGGGSAGYLAFMKINRTDKYGLILLTNVSAFHERAKEVEALSDKLME